MPSGIQVFNVSGNLVLDFTDELYYIFGTVTTTGGVNGSISDSRIVPGKTIVLPYNYDYQDLSAGLSPSDPPRSQQLCTAHRCAVLPEITVYDGTISWRYPPLRNSGGKFISVTFAYGGVLT